MAAALAVFAPSAGAIGGGWNENSWTGNGRGSNKVEIYSREDYRQAPRRLCTGGVIDQREVVTSAHRLDEANERGEPELWVAADSVHRGAGRWIHVVSAEKSPHDAADLAVPALDTDVGIPEDKLLHAYSYDRAPPEVGHPTTFIGFGKDATGNLAPRLKGIRVRAVENGVWDNRGAWLSGTSSWAGTPAWATPGGP